MAEDDSTVVRPAGTTGPGEPGTPPPDRGGKGAATRRPRPRRTRRLLDPREWRVRVKLVAVLAVPTAAFLALAGVNLTTLVLDAQAYEADARTAELGRDVAALTHELQRERDLTSGFFVVRDEPAQRQLATQRRAVDDAVARYRARVTEVREGASGPLARTLTRVSRDLSSLDRLRDAVDDRTVTRQAAVDEYGSDVAHLLDVVGGVTGSGDAELTQRLRVLAAFAESKDRASETRGVVLTLALQDRFGTGEYEQLTTALANERAASQRFLESADDGQRALVSRTVRGQALLTVSRLEEQALQGGGRSLDVDPDQWLAASTTRQQQMAQAERLLLDRVVDRSEALSGSAQQQAVVTGSAIVAVLLVSLLLSLGVARSMARQLSSLRRGALDVAQVQLPESVSRIREAKPGDDPEQEVPSLNLHSRDEVGQVAAAFDAVHRQAVRLAGEQAVLRRDVNTLFVNFSRRSQSLVERQLSLIDDLEAREQDPSVLENLFRLDHLATRMRRNNESLLVIAGSDTTRRWTRPVPLPDVVLASVSEIEQFTRVEQQTDSDVAVAGHAVSDLVHLLAELLENATRSSPPSTNVTVSGRAVRGGTEALLEVEDSGFGMTKEVLRDANRRLGDPGSTVPSGPRMGLFVVSRLARRYGILVDLDESPHGGVVARVRLPASLVTTSSVQDGGRAEVQGGGRVAPTTRTSGTDDSPVSPYGTHAEDSAAEGGRPADEARTDAAASEADAHRATGHEGTTHGVTTDGGTRDDAPAHGAAHGPSNGTSGGTAHAPSRTPANGAANGASGPTTPARGTPAAAAGAGGPRREGRNDETSTVVLPVFDSVSEWFRDQPGTVPDDGPAGDGFSDPATPGTHDVVAAADTGWPVGRGSVAGETGATPAWATGPQPVVGSSGEGAADDPTAGWAVPESQEFAHGAFGDTPANGDVPAFGSAPTHNAPAHGAPTHGGAPARGDDAAPDAGATGAAPADAVPGSAARPPRREYETGPGGLPRRPVGDTSGGDAPASWPSTGDAGWAAAEEAASPTSAGTTSAGLPIRRPMAHFVPGASDSPRANDGDAPAPEGAPSTGDDDDGGRAGSPQGGVHTGPATSPDLLRPAESPGLAGSQASATSPEQVRGLLSRYYRGVREARQVSDTTTAEGAAPGTPAAVPEYDSNAHEGEST